MIFSINKIIKNKGFSLIGVMISISMIVVGVVSVITLTSSIFSIERMSNNKFIATLLAREGIENIRQIRDTNWMIIQGGSSSASWQDSICPGPGTQTFYLDGSSYTLTAPSSPSLSFERTVTADPCTPVTDPNAVGATPPPPIKVTSKVSWTDKGKTRDVELTEYLHDWMKLP